MGFFSSGVGGGPFVNNRQLLKLYIISLPANTFKQKQQKKIVLISMRIRTPRSNSDHVNY